MGKHAREDLPAVSSGGLLDWQAKVLRTELEKVVIPVQPGNVCNPWKMEPGDCQRALAQLWERAGMGGELSD